MITDIEKQFFDTFGIEPKDRFKGCKNGIDFYSYACEIPSCKGCPEEIREKEYPQITDSILLKLICILTCYYLDEREPYEITSINIEQLKQQILSDIIRIADCEATKCQVQKIFKEI